MSQQENRVPDEEPRTKKLLLESGMKFFLQFGYEKASLRRIVADAGFTSGAFYGYFASKAELFYALVDETAAGLYKILSSINDEMMAIPAEYRLYEIAATSIRHIPNIADFMLAHPKEMLLLMKCSKGTRYENFLDEIRRRDMENIESGIQGLLDAGVSLKPLSHYTMEVLLNGYISMLTRVLIEQTDRDMICRCMEDISRVYEQGVLHMLEIRDDRSGNQKQNP